MAVVSPIELEKDPLEIIKILGDRIEEIERTLCDDEDFCNKDLDATYQAAFKYMKNLEEKCHEKLTELKTKLDEIREENMNTSTTNKKQFEDDMEEINQVFSSGKHQEALEKFQDYEKRFEQRVTIIVNIPKLHMKNIDINQFFSFNDQLNILSNDDNQITTDSQKSIELDKKDEDVNHNTNEQQTNKFFPVIRSKPSDNQQISTNNNTLKKVPFSTRLGPLPNTKSIPVPEHDIGVSSLGHSTNSNSSGNIIRQTQVRSTPSSPNINSSLMQCQITPVKSGIGEILTLTNVCSYQHERNISILMTSNKDYISLFKNQPGHKARCYLGIIERFNGAEHSLDWHDGLIISLGFIDKTNLYIFTEHHFIIYSLDSCRKLNSIQLSNSYNENFEYDDLQCGIGTVYDKYIYHIYLNSTTHWILSIFELENINYICNYDLTEIFPEVKRFIHICINNQTVNFLIEMDGLQYGVMFCLINNCISIERKGLIKLSYAESPLVICSAFIPYLKKYLFFINDPSAKIIHILTNEKYLQSFRLIAYALCYIEDSHELMITSNDQICSIYLNEQDRFFSKFFSK